MKTTIEELNGDFPNRKVDLKILVENETLMIYVPGETHDSLVAAVEIWEGELRTLVWPDMSNEDVEPSIIKIEEPK